ncbi:PilW family protein [uncultured Marinobacter sp.]|uniref:PilW family protein n=1 Tax=uncultured Marinobacter sp. TaxID=187379 RepID=UPI0026373D28|nr:PilW family protein [uncultured Marinobacter sp.]
MRNVESSRKLPQQGFTLVELMVSMTLGLILTAGLVQIFVSNKQSFVMSQALSNVQESGREGAMILAREIRNADYWGCISTATSVQNNLNSEKASDLLDFSRGLEIFPDADSNNAIVDGSHVLFFRGISGAPEVGVEKVPAADASSLHVTDASPFSKGDILLVTDCEHANIFQATTVSDKGNDLMTHNKGDSFDPGNEITTMPKKYTNNAKIYRPSVQRYSIQADDQGRRSLVVERALLANNSTNADGFGDPVELVADIRDMRTLIGVDTDGDGAVNSWQDPPEKDAANAANLLAQTLVVKVSLLARSRDDNVNDDAVQFCFPGWLDCTSEATGLQTADDSALYRVYTMTASLRNRTLEGT